MMPMENVYLTKEEIKVLRDALYTEERKFQQCRRNFFSDWMVRDRCEKAIDAVRRVDSILASVKFT